MKNIIDQLAAGELPTKAELGTLLENHEEQGLSQYLAARAMEFREKYFGRQVYLRGLIEFTSFCRRDCLYCGLRHSNPNASRYRLNLDEILACCSLGYDLDFRTFVLQGGEDPYFTPARLEEMVSAIRQKFPDCAITLSAGEHNRETYARLRQAGADRYLLRHETADQTHYEYLHPPTMSWATRHRCLNDLKELGFQTGAGFMVGSPGQTYDHLVDDLYFLKNMAPQMIGVGPFIPHPATPFGEFPPGNAGLVMFILGILRIMLPQCLLPATTALGTIAQDGREKALDFGANVLMPNLSPLDVRKKYDIYAGKIHLNQEAAEGVTQLKNRLRELGFETAAERGDFPVQCK